MACVHRITGGEASYCFLQSKKTCADDPSARTLVFQGAKEEWPAPCDRQMLAACPFREVITKSDDIGRIVSCPYCHGRHRTGSTSKRLCEDWHSVKSVLKEMRERRPPIRYLEQGTTILPYRPDTPELVRQLIWLRLKGAVLRRDRYACQDCGEMFGRARRKLWDQAVRRGQGGYRWESLEVHHIIPRSKGGSDHPGNLKTLCPSCHRKYTSEQLCGRAGDRRREREILRAAKELIEEHDTWDHMGE
ncbi:MAG TPA: HNH endonuclease [Methanomassiliicoccales archaeon]|nr:HNH endonuclease [Methanomassiliicoccales archaeon]